MLKKIPLSLMLVFLVLGLLISTQYQSQQAVMKSLAEQKPEDLAILITNMNDRRYDLNQDRIDLNSQLRIFQDDATKEEQLVDSLEAEIDRIQLANGEFPVEGPGLVILISSFINFQDLTAIVNDLWHSKAEAIAINGIRLTNHTALGETEDWIPTVDGKEIRSPIRIEALGDPSELEKKMTISGGNISLLRTYQVRVDIEQQEELILPEAKNRTTFRYASHVEE